MKKRTVIILAALIDMLTGCDSIGSSDRAEIERLKKKVANLEEGVEELRGDRKESKDSEDGLFAGIPDVETEDESANWTDDTVISFTDKEFTKYIRDVLGVPEGNLTYGMVKNMSDLEISATGRVPDYGESNWEIDDTNFDQLKWFTGLKSISIYLDNDMDAEVEIPSTLVQ